MPAVSPGRSTEIMRKYLALSLNDSGIKHRNTLRSKYDPLHTIKPTEQSQPTHQHVIGLSQRRRQYRVQPKCIQDINRCCFLVIASPILHVWMSSQTFNPLRLFSHRSYHKKVTLLLRNYGNGIKSTGLPPSCLQQNKADRKQSWRAIPGPNPRFNDLIK